jgi:hypothetical protein
LAQTCVFSKQSLPPILCDLDGLRARGSSPTRHTLSRSYGVNLPSSLTRVLSSALEYSSRPPESVCGTDSLHAPSAAFLGSLESLSSALHGVRHLSSPLGVEASRLSGNGPERPAYGLEPATNSWLSYPSPSPLISTHTSRFRNINLIPIAYARRPRLRTRLTPGG